jgi:quinol monooxygenase YgiN
VSVVVVATVLPKPGKADEVEAVFAKFMETVHTEPGCELYALHRNARAGTLVLIEKWADADALALHGKGPGIAELTAVLGELSEPGGGGPTAVLEPAPHGDAGKGTL